MISVGFGSFVPRDLNNGRELRQDVGQQEDRHARGQNHHHGRIGHRRADLAAGFRFLAQVRGDAV